MKIKVNINGETHEVEQSDLSLPEGVSFISPDNVPEGYYTKDAMESKIQDRVGRAKRNAKSELLDDEDFQKQVLARKNILLDEDGKPKGLKPEVDVEQVKKQTAQQISSEWEEKLNKTQSELQNIKSGKKAGDILRAANGMFQEQYVKSFTGNDDPFVVNQFGKFFDVDENGNTALLDDSGEGFAIDGQGNHITPDKYFEKNKDKFSDLLQDKRQKGSGFQNGKKANGRMPEGDEIMKMSDEEWEKSREEIIKNSSN